MEESLIKVAWSDKDFGHNAHEIFYDEKTDEVIFIMIDGIDSGGNYLVSEIGYDVFTEENYKVMVDYIRGLQNPKFEYTKPSEGEFIVVVKINSWQSNSYYDPVEYDMSIDFLGILGREVKLTYEGKKL